MSRDMLPRIDVDRPQVFNGIEVSYGIAPILHTLSELANKSMRPKWDLFLFNVETLIRDRKDESKTVEEIARATLLDCTVLFQYTSMYCQMTLPANGQIKPIACFFLPYYERLPKVHLRAKFPKGTEERWAIRDRIIEIITKEGYQTAFGDIRVLFDVVGMKGNWPHKDLVKDLMAYQKGIQYAHTLLISHVPIDFHLYRVFSDFTILESYTGALKKQKQLGKKVFQHDELPFNKYTHLLFGDKWYLRGLLESKGKKEVKERATKEHWSLMNEKAILASAIGMRAAIPDLLIKPDL